MKRFWSLFLTALIIVFCTVPTFAFAENSKLTYLYIDKGSIVIGDGTVSGYGYFGELITSYDPDGYYITQTEEGVVYNTITFDGGENYVVFSSLNIDVSQYSKFTSAVCLKNSSVVTVKSEGTNMFVSGSSRAGIEVPKGSSLTLIGEGTIMAGSDGEAGIGGGNGAQSGNVTINSGTILAVSKNNGAGIGGGSSSANGRIVINGGNVTARGGVYGAGIGGGCTGDGGEIIINGGTITSSGGNNAAGIGGGWYGSTGNIVIDGGSVKSVGGTNAPSLGSGANASSDAILNSVGEELFLAKVSASSVSDVKEIYTNGKANNINSFHSGDSYFYFYLPAQTHIIAIDSENSLTSFLKATYNNGFSTSAVEPFVCKNSSVVRSDDVIIGLTCGLSSLDEYVTLSDGFSFSFSEQIIGTGTEVDLVYDGKKVFSYVALIYGDVNGDGFYDGEDAFVVSLIIWEHLTKENTDEIFFEAADVDRSSAVNAEDKNILQQAGLLLASVSQNDDGTVDTDCSQWEEYILLIDQSPEAEEDNNVITQEPTDNSDVINKVIELLFSILEFIKNIVFSLF